MAAGEMEVLMEIGRFDIDGGVKLAMIPRHEINNTANILKSVNEKNELITWKKIFIHKHAYHIMNFEVPPVSSLINHLTGYFPILLAMYCWTTYIDVST